MDYKVYGKDSDGKKVEDRRARKWERNKNYLHNRGLHSSKSKKNASKDK